MPRSRFVLWGIVLLLSVSCLLAQRGPFGPDRDRIPEGSRVVYKTFESRILGRELPYGLYFPPSYAGSSRSYPVLYFLHGANENERRWSTRGLTDLKLDRMIAAGEIGEFIVAIPFGENSFYTNSVAGERWEDMILDEFIPMIESETRAIGTRQGRAISGISMGGYGALKLAFRHPDRFDSVSAHSAMLIDNLDGAAAASPRAQFFYPLFDMIFGVSNDLVAWNQNNPLRIAEQVESLEGLEIYFDCGTEDEYRFFAGARQLHEILEARGIAHEFHLYPGNHGWDYAQQHTGASLQFHWNAFDDD